MRNGLLLLAALCLTTTSLVAQAAQTAKPADPPATPAATANADKKETKVSEKVLKAYVGEYEFAPERTLTITLEKGSLWGQPTGQPARQMFAESPTKFFLKDVPVTLEFKKDEKGNVTSVYMIQEGRGERDLKKIK